MAGYNKAGYPELKGIPCKLYLVAFPVVRSAKVFMSQGYRGAKGSNRQVMLECGEKRGLCIRVASVG